MESATGNFVFTVFQLCVDVFYLLVDFGSLMVRFFGQTVNEFILDQGLSIVVPDPYGNISIIVYVLGSFVPIFLLAYLVGWIIDIIVPN